jgi:hypothetical protein
MRKADTGMTSMTFSFGPLARPDGFIAVDADAGFDAARGWGWLGTPKLHVRDRGQPAAPRGTLVLGLGPATFRVVTGPGLYRLRFGFCDVHFQNHAIRIAVAGCAGDIPVIEPRSIEHVTLEIFAAAQDGMVDIAFSSPGDNWIVNWLELSPALSPAAPPAVTRERIYRDMWRLPPQTPRGPLAQIARWRGLPAAEAEVAATGLGAGDYLAAIRDSVRHFAAQQDARGAIIDADAGVEIQYATPCFAHAAALVARHDGDAALAERAIRATSHAVQALATRSAASEHEDFFPAPLAHALRLLAGTAPAGLQATWRDALAGMDPYATYRNRVGGLDGAGSNWNCKALAGEALLHLAGIRADPSYAERSLLEQGRFFDNEFGLYTEGPMTYDAFPRVWLADMLEAGYAGPGAAPLRETLQHGALTSLLMQSPSGELPAGGRSGQHLWSDALQVPMFEIAAKRLAAAGDPVLAGSFKRAARRAFAALLRWQRPSGEFQVVKNRAEPATRHGYEGYSSHSHYNLLLLSILAHGFEHAQATEGLAERITPAETGGFALELPGPFHKAFAAAGGSAVQLCLRTEDRQTPAGLVRIAFDGIPGEMGPGDGLVGRPFFQLPDSPRTDLGIGLAWTGADGQVRSLAATGRRELETAVTVLAESPAEVRLGVEWRLAAEKLAFAEEYTVARDEVAIRYRGGEGLREARLRWPVLAHDGARPTAIAVTGMRVAVAHDGASIEYVLEGTEPPQLGTALIAHRQGFVRVAEARLRPGQEPRLVVRAVARVHGPRRWRDRPNVPNPLLAALRPRATHSDAAPRRGATPATGVTNMSTERPAQERPAESPAPGAPPRKTLAVVTMAYNETDMLPIWLRYYAAQVGADACYVVDHGTNDGSTDDLRGANRVRLPRSALDNPKRTDFCAELCSALLKYYDYVMYTDSDEIVTPDPAEHRTLIDYVSAGERAPVTSALGLNLVHRLHHETTIDLSKPIIGQRRWGFPTSSMCKPLLIREPVKWAPGFHSSKHPIVFDGLYLFHLAYYDLRTALRRQEKRRQTEKKTADTAVHHRVGDDQVTAWISGWSSMKLDTDVTMRRDDPAVVEFATRVADSAKGREDKVFGIDLGISGNRLWRIPERFVGQF